MKKIGYFFVAIVAALGMESCDVTKIDHQGPAKFVLKNITTGEEKTFEGTELGYTTPTLSIRNNDSLQVKFVPELDYVKYGFEVTFTIFNNETIKDYEYPYLYKLKVQDITSGEYTFKCHAIVDDGDVKIKEEAIGKVEVE